MELAGRFPREAEIHNAVYLQAVAKQTAVLEIRQSKKEQSRKKEKKRAAGENTMRKIREATDTREHNRR